MSVKVIKFFVLAAVSALLSSCFPHKISVDGYRYISFEKVRRDTTGKLSGKPTWMKDPNYISAGRADTFKIYRNFDSIRMTTPYEHQGYMFRKTNIKAKRWKPQSRYGKMSFVGNYFADHLPGMYVSFYMTGDRSSIMQILYNHPGYLTDVILFHKYPENLLKENGIVVDGNDEDSEPWEMDISF